MSALDVTRRDFFRAMRRIASRPAVDAAVRANAERLAAEIATAGGVEAAVVREGAGRYAVVATGPGLFAREFGSMARAAEPVIAPAVERVATRRDPEGRAGEG